MEAYDAAVARCPLPLESRYLPTAFGSTHLLVGGPIQGDPVILLHGWNGNASFLWAEFPFLLHQFRTYMIDVIGHPGKSAPTRPSTSGSHLADWLAELLDLLSIDKAGVVGISGGGWLALKFISYYPSRVIQAAALSSDGLVPIRVARMMLSRSALAPLFATPTTMRWFSELVTSPRGRRSVHYDEFSAAMLPVFRHFRVQRNPGLLTDQEIRRILTPTLILMGEDECFFDPHAALERAVSQLPGLVAAEIVADAGHAMTLDQPEALKARINRFFHELS